MKIISLSKIAKFFLEFLKNNRVETVHTFDFENLFTSIPHANLLSICEQLYAGYLINEEITRNDSLDLCSLNIFEYFLFNGQNFFKVKNGIPMGNSFSSAFANIFFVHL